MSGSGAHPPLRFLVTCTTNLWFLDLAMADRFDDGSANRIHLTIRDLTFLWLKLWLFSIDFLKSRPSDRDRYFDKKRWEVFGYVETTLLCLFAQNTEPCPLDRTQRAAWSLSDQSWRATNRHWRPTWTGQACVLLIRSSRVYSWNWRWDALKYVKFDLKGSDYKSCWKFVASG